MLHSAHNKDSQFNGLVIEYDISHELEFDIKSFPEIGKILNTCVGQKTGPKSKDISKIFLN